jgi:hypothetical protein
MTISLTYDELSQYLSEHYGKTLTFEKITASELRIAYAQKVFIKTLNIPINIIVDKVRPTSIDLTYKGGLGIDTLITGALKFIKAGYPMLDKAIIYKENHNITVDLKQIPQAKSLIEKVTLKDILFCDNHLELRATLR